jgi:hypothetical protein
MSFCQVHSLSHVQNITRLSRTFSILQYRDKYISHLVGIKILIDFNLSEFVTTLTELNAIAPAANIGLSKPIAAKGMPIQ